MGKHIMLVSDLCISSLVESVPKVISQDVDIVLQHIFDNTAITELVGVINRNPDCQYVGSMYRWVSGTFDQTKTKLASWTTSVDAIRQIYYNLAPIRGSIGTIIAQEGTGFGVNYFLEKHMRYIQRLLDDDSLDTLNEYMEEDEIIGANNSPVIIGITTDRQKIIFNK